MKESKNLGNLALILDSSNSSGSAATDVVEIFKSKNIEFKIIDLIDSNILLDCQIWKKFDCAWIALGNESKLSFGYIQGFLEILGIRYTGTGMGSAALAGDRLKSKKIWQISGIATTPCFKWEKKLNWQEILGLIGLPLAIKSLNLVEKKVIKLVNLEQITEIYNQFENLNQVAIEPWIVGEEYVVHIINNQVLTPIKVNSNLELQEEQPITNLSNMKKLALDAFLALGGQGFAEVQILRDLNDDYWVLGINIGLSLARNSSFAVAAYKSGIVFEDLIDHILATSFKTNQNLLVSDP